MESENLSNYEQQRAYIKNQVRMIMEGQIDSGRKIPIVLSILESGFAVDIKFYKEFVLFLNLEENDDYTSISGSEIEIKLHEAFLIERNKINTSFREAFLKIASNTNPEFTQDIFETLVEADIFEIDQAIANNSNPSITEVFLRKLAIKTYDNQRQLKHLCYIVEKNILERQKLLLKESSDFFGTPILPIYEGVDMYEQLETLLKTAKLLYPDGVEKKEIINQLEETPAMLLDPGYKGGIPFHLAKIRLIKNSSSWSVKEKFIRQAGFITNWVDLKKRGYEEFDQVADNYFISMYSFSMQGQKMTQYAYGTDENNILKVHSKIIWNQNEQVDKPRFLQFFKEQKDHLKNVLQKVKQENLPTFEQLQFEAQVEIEYTKLIEYETQEQIWFDKLKAQIETNVSGGMLEYLIRELLGKDFDLEDNSTKITLSKESKELEVYKNKKAKDFIDGMFLIFVGKLELYKDDIFLNEQIHKFWLELNFTFETDRYTDDILVGQLPKIYLQITIELLQKLKIGYEKKKPKLLQPGKTKDVELKPWYKKILNLRKDNIKSEPNLNELLIQEIKTVDQMIFAISKLLL